MILYIIGLAIMGLIISLFTLYRNNKVNEYREQLLIKIGVACYNDVDNELDWRWRYTEYDKVPYAEMVYKFWKPLDSFYKDKKFVE